MSIQSAYSSLYGSLEPIDQELLEESEKPVNSYRTNPEVEFSIKHRRKRFIRRVKEGSIKPHNSNKPSKPRNFVQQDYSGFNGETEDVEDKDIYCAFSEDAESTVSERNETHLVNGDFRQMSKKSRGAGANKMLRKASAKVREGMESTRKIGRGVKMEKVRSMMDDERKKVLKANARKRDGERKDELRLNFVSHEIGDEAIRAEEVEDRVGVSQIFAKHVRSKRGLRSRQIAESRKIRRAIEAAKPTDAMIFEAEQMERAENYYNSPTHEEEMYSKHMPAKPVITQGHIDWDTIKYHSEIAKQKAAIESRHTIVELIEEGLITRDSQRSRAA